MNPLLLLLLAIVSEVAATTALKASAGLTRPAPTAVVLIGYATAFYLLSLSLKQIPLGTAYAIWSGLGTLGAVLAGVLLWREPLDAARVVGIAMIVGGVLVLNLLAKSPAA